MRLERMLHALVQAVLDEAARNPSFRERLEAALDDTGAGKPFTEAKRPHRRATPAFDPIEAAREGEHVLRNRLATLDLEQLKDIVAAHGMDPGKLVMKWKSPDRVIDRIVEMALSRASKGESFLAP